MLPVPHAFPLHHVCVLRLSLGFAAFSGARVHAGFAGCASRSGSLDPCRLSREDSCQTLPEWGSLLLPLRSPAPAHPLLAHREGEPAPQGARRAVPVREDAAAPRAAQFRGLRGYLATRRPAARLLHSHQHAGGDRAVSAQSSRMGRGARPPYPFRNSRHLLGFFFSLAKKLARAAAGRPFRETELRKPF